MAFIVNDTSPRVRITASGGAQTVFPVGFPFEADADLVVLQDSLGDGVWVALVLDTDYTVTGEGTDSGGNVTLTTAATDNDRIVIYRDQAVEQTTTFISTITAAGFQLALNLLTMAVQQIERTVNEDVLRISPEDVVAEGDMILPSLANQAGEALLVGSDEKSWTFGDQVTGGIFERWVEYSELSVATTTEFLLGILPADHVLISVNVDVTEAFDSGTTDALSVGNAGAVGAYHTAAVITSTGMQHSSAESAAVPADVGRYSSAAQNIRLIFTAAGAASTQGKVHILVRWAHVSTTP